MGDGKVSDPHVAGKQHCHVCGSKEVRYLRKTKTIYCRVCGAEWPAKWVDRPTQMPWKDWKKGG